MSVRPDTLRAVGVVTSSGEDHQVLPEETPVALVYNGSTLAVMMATPADLEDFATGFAITEGVADPAELDEIELAVHADGIEARMWLSEASAKRLDERRRASVGPTGCGLCGIDSLAQANRALPRLPDSDTRLSAADIATALQSLRNWQPLHDETHAVHAAGFYIPGTGIVAAREDVGRHNALDKLIGALHRAGIDASTGAIVLTSRVSVDMVQKAVMAGCPTLFAVSAPTAHAVRLAETSGLTIATTRKGEARIYTHPTRIEGTT